MRAARLRTLRVRLTALFALGAALMVLAVSLLIVAAQSRNSNEIVTRNLRARISRIVDGLRGGGKLPATEVYAQVFTQFGTVRDLSSAIGNDEFLLDSEQRRFVFSSGSLQFDRNIPALGGPARLLAEPKDIDGTSVVVVVGASLELESQSRHRLLRTLTIVGPLLVLLLGLGGWGVAGAALRPMRRMTDRAAAITRADAGDRLPIPDNADEIAHLGRTLNAMLDRLEASFRREQAFVDDASHELRTPLAILRGELELGLLHPGDEQERRRMLVASIEEVDRLGRLADDLLVLARMGAGREGVSAAPIDLLPCATEIVDRIHATLPSAISCDVKGGSTFAAIRPEHVERVLTNLVGNAGRFANTRITIDIAADGPWAVMRVHDDGPGFPVTLLPRVFERFVVASESRTRSAAGGTGIGLAIVQAIAHRHGGTVSAANDPPRGAVVTLRLPLVVGLSAGADATTSPSSATTLARPVGHTANGVEEVLVADQPTDQPADQTADQTADQPADGAVAATAARMSSP